MASAMGTLRASSRVASADPAAVRIAVMAVPSISATGEPVSGSNTAITAWWVGIVVPALPGNRLTSFVTRAPFEGR